MVGQTDQDEAMKNQSDWFDCELTEDAYKHLEFLTPALNRACGTDLDVNQIASLIILLRIPRRKDNEMISIQSKEEELEDLEDLFLSNLTVAQRDIYRHLVQTHRGIEALDSSCLTEKGANEIEEHLLLARYILSSFKPSC